MKRLFFAVLLLGAFFGACSDDDSFYPVKDEVSDASSGSGETSKSSSAENKSSSSSARPVETHSYGLTETAWSLLNPDIEYGEFVDNRDGKVYKTVQIGSQTWMAQNLAFDPKLKDKDDRDWNFCRVGARCDTIGYHYPWNVMIDTMGLYGSASFGFRSNPGTNNEIFEHHMRGICPEGWHVPHSDEFRVLIDYVGGEDVAAQKLKALSGWEKASKEDVDPNGLDTYGFSLLPTGDPDNGSGSTYVWAALGAYDGTFQRYYMGLHAMWEKISILKEYKRYSMVLRCVKDLKEIPYTKDPVPACNENGVDNCEYGELLDERDYRKYKTVTIGKQTWMAENLLYNSNYYDEELGDTIETSWCLTYQAGCQFGRYYSWAGAMDSSGRANGKPTGCGLNSPCRIEGKVRGVCPTGWHMPDTTEVNELVNYIHYVGKKYGSAQALKKYSVVFGRRTVIWSDHEQSGAVDAYGFGALPIGGGRLDSLGRVEDKDVGILFQCSTCQDMEGGGAIFWASCPATETEMAACAFSMAANRRSVITGTTNPLNLIPIRCLKD